jgi:hypothetical protein
VRLVERFGESREERAGAQDGELAERRQRVFVAAVTIGFLRAPLDRRAACLDIRMVASPDE